MTAKKFNIFGLIFSGLGVLDSGYIFLTHNSSGAFACNLIEGCDVVLSSAYATMFGLPVALYGVVYYAFLFILFLGSFLLKDRRTLFAAALITPAGLLASLWFMYLQLFVLDAICQFCMISALSSTLLFIFALIYLTRGRKEV